MLEVTENLFLVNDQKAAGAYSPIVCDISQMISGFKRV